MLKLVKRMWRCCKAASQEWWNTNSRASSSTRYTTTVAADSAGTRASVARVRTVQSSTMAMRYAYVTMPPNFPSTPFTTTPSPPAYLSGRTKWQTSARWRYDVAWYGGRVLLLWRRYHVLFSSKWQIYGRPETRLWDRPRRSRR